MATGSPNREFTSDELDALAAAELPVQDAQIPPNASTAIAASGAPGQTGSPGLITGEGALPARGPAMGPVAQLEAREYTTAELDLLDQANKPKEFTSDELDQEAVAALEDPNYVPTRDEYFDQKATKARLKAQGKIPGNGELAAKAVGGLFVSAFDAFNSTLFSPVETLARSPATLQTGIGRAAISAMQLGGWAKQALEGQPQYLNEATGEFLFADAQDPMILAGFQERYPNQPIRATNEEDLKDYEFQNHIKEKGIDAEYQALGQKTAPTELLTRVLTGRNQQETPIESQAQVLEIATDPTNLIPFGAGAKTLGLSRGMKIVSSKTASGIEKLAGGLVKGNDALAERFARVVTEKTGVSPQNISAAANAMTFGRNVGIGGGIAAGAAALGAPPEVTATIAGFYPAYKAGMGVLRKIETGAGASKIILRESADATNGLDQAARAAVLANPAVPSIFKEVLERPSQFVSIESTPARLAANQALSPQMRAFMGKLSNPAIVQAVRGSSALATGAAKGAAANVPFALLAANAGQDEDAAAMLAMGGTFGALGGGVDRFTGLQQRRQQAALSDVSRMLVDIELNAGDVGKMMATQTPDNLVRLAAMQGTFRNNLDFVPLSAEDYDANVAAQGGAGTAGMFVQAPLGERAKVFINLDARRGGVEPHEFGHALLASGALDGQQKYAARAWVDKTYGAEGIQARATEYASNIIRGKNASAFPDGNFEISPGTLTAEMENLSQGGLARGDMDGLDWARDEIFAETFAKASNTMDFAAIRRGAPAGGNMLTFAESILGAQARALSASGVRIDPQTGQSLDTPGSLFKENPILATDKALLNQLGTYINNYRQWANDPTHEKPRPNRIAPSGRASDIANNPQVTFYDRGDGVQATTFATKDPVTGQAILRDQRDLNKEHAKVKEQIKNIVGSKLIPDSNPVLGPKKTADGRVTVRGRVLPPSFDFLNGFMPHIRAFARQFEALGAAGESMQVRYHAIGSGDTGAFRVNRLGNLEAITREVIPWGWELTKAGNLNATVLDLSQFRNRAMRGIAERNPALAPFDYDMGKIEADLKTYMENHRQELPGSTKIGDEKRDTINAIIGIATTKNRERNALSGSFGPGSAIKQFRLDRVDAAVGTGRQGFHFDYDRANRNFMPDKPAPMPDLSQDLPTAKGQAMPDDQRAAEQSGQPSRGGLKAQALGKQDADYLAAVDRLDIETAQRMVFEKAFGKEFADSYSSNLAKYEEIDEKISKQEKSRVPYEKLKPLYEKRYKLLEKTKFPIQRLKDKEIKESAKNAIKLGIKIDASKIDPVYHPEIIDEIVSNQSPVSVKINGGGTLLTRDAFDQSVDGSVVLDGAELTGFLDREFLAYPLKNGNDFYFAVTGEQLAKIRNVSVPSGAYQVADTPGSLAKQIVTGEGITESNPIDIFERKNEIFYIEASSADVEFQQNQNFTIIKERNTLDPITYDEQGNVIPLSKRFNQPTPGQAMPDVTITPDEAKRQGLVGPVYHGSPDFKGQKFDLKYRARNSGLSRGGFSFTDNVESAKGYASNQIDSAQSAVDTANDVMRELAGRMDNGLKVDGFADSAELPEFNSRYVDDIESLGSYFDEIADKIPNDLGDRLRAAASKTNEPANPVVVEAFLRNPKVTEINGKKLWLTENPDDIFVSGTTRPPQGQAMPDAVHSAGYALPKKVPQRGYFSIGTLPTTDGRVLEYHVDPTTTIQPRVAGINSIRGEQVAMLEADRHNTRGDNMGGPLHPFLISNQTVARLPDGRGYKAVWANMNSAFVTRAKNIVKTTTAGHALIQIMKENAHRSNRKFVMDVTAEIDKRSSTMSKDQVDFLHVVLELGAINPKGRMNQAASKLERTAKAALNKEVPMQELADAQKEYDATLNKYQPMVEFLSRLSPLKSHATRGRMPAFDNEFASILSNYRNQPWFESMASKYRNTKFVDEAARFSFNQRGAAMDRITGIPFAPNVKSMLKSSMDFVNGQNLDVVGVVQLSKDADAFAVYFGKNSKEEGKMSPNERLLRNQLLASGSFKPHPSYDWVMLGPENADSFILDTPADPLKLFPDYAKNHPNKNVRKGSKETVVGTMKKSKIPLVLK